MDICCVVSKSRLKYIVLHADSLCHESAELEIRSCSITAVKKVCDQIKMNFIHDVTSDVLDFVKPYKIPVLVDNILFSLLELDWFDKYESKLLYDYSTILHNIRINRCCQLTSD